MVRQTGQTSTGDGFDKLCYEDMKPENLIKNGISSRSPTETFFSTAAADRINLARALLDSVWNDRR